MRRQESATCGIISETRGAYYGFYLAGFCVWLLVQVIVLMGTGGRTIGEGFANGLINVACPMIAGLGILPIWQRLHSRGPAVIALVLGLVGAGFVAATLVIGSGLVGLLRLMDGGGWDPIWLTGPALVWQVNQTILTYAVVLLATLLHQLLLDMKQLRHADRSALTAPVSAPILVGTVNGLAPVEVDEIIAIEAKDDDTILITRTGRKTVQRTMIRWESELDPACFVRVHRSWMINLARTLSIEPAGGGRMIAHLPGGLHVPVSRAGAARVRERMV